MRRYEYRVIVEYSDKAQCTSSRVKILIRTMFNKMSGLLSVPTTEANNSKRLPPSKVIVREVDDNPVHNSQMIDSSDPID